MIKKLILGSVLFANVCFAHDVKKEETFEQWLVSQRTLLQNPVSFVCLQACTLQYTQCSYKYNFFMSRRDEKSAKAPNAKCTTLYQECYHKCVVGLTSVGNNPPPNDNGSTPPDSDPSNDETNIPGDPTQPPIK